MLRVDENAEAPDHSRSAAGDDGLTNSHDHCGKQGALPGKAEAVHTRQPTTPLLSVSPRLQKSLQAGVSLKSPSRFM